MHPPLFQPHPLCEGEVQALVRCHEENKVSKFWGACNDSKHALDMCFRVRGVPPCSPAAYSRRLLPMVDSNLHIFLPPSQPALPTHSRRRKFYGGN